MPKQGGSNKKEQDWNELLKVMQTPVGNGSNCHIIASSYDSLNNHNYNRNSSNRDSRNKQPKGWFREKRRDEDACAARFKRIFASCCAESNLGKRVKDLEYKVKRLERIYCKQVKKQLDELHGKKSDKVKKSSESIGKNTGSGRKNSGASNQEPRRTSTSSNRVVFKKESTRNTEEGFSDDSSTQGRKENYFFITTPNYFDKDQIPVRDVGCSSQVEKVPLEGKSRIALEGNQKKNQWLESMRLHNAGPDLTCRYKYLNNGEVKKPFRSMKNSFDNEELEKSSRSLKYSFGYKELEKLSGSINNSFVEYTSILKQTKDINPVAANIASFNNASKAKNHKPIVATAPASQPLQESFSSETNENEIKEDIENDTGIKSLSEKAVDSVVAVEKIHRSVSTCKLPIDINLYLFPKLDTNIEGSALSDVKVFQNSNIRSGVSRGVCFDTPASCSSSQVSFKFASVIHRRSSST